MIRKIMIGAALIAASAMANATPVLVEGFDNIGTLGASGWVQTNNSTAGGTTSWFQGNTGVFSSQSGAPDSYIAANFLNAGIGGSVDNWLITPELTYLGEFTELTFATRTGGFGGDNLSVYYNLTGSTNVADFVLIGSVTSDFYPSADWGLFTTGNLGNWLGQSVRFAFRYTVADTNVGGDYIGIDTVTVNSSVPEPGTLALLAACLIMIPMLRRRRAQV